jgi:uncharacterized protein
VRLPDVNVLVAALRPDAGHHDRCRTWLEDTVNDARPFALTGLVLAGVVRVLTHPRIFAPPSDLGLVVAELERLVGAPRAIRVEPGRRHWRLFSELVATADARGNLVTDAWLAAVAMEHGCTLVTLDGDFARFSGLDRAAP